VLPVFPSYNRELLLFDITFKNLAKSWLALFKIHRNLSKVFNVLKFRWYLRFSRKNFHFLFDILSIHIHNEFRPQTNQISHNLSSNLVWLNWPGSTFNWSIPHRNLASFKFVVYQIYIGFHFIIWFKMQVLFQFGLMY
jgi:hypothetical protein